MDLSTVTKMIMSLATDILLFLGALLLVVLIGMVISYVFRSK